MFVVFLISIETLRCAVDSEFTVFQDEVQMDMELESRRCFQEVNGNVKNEVS